MPEMQASTPLGMTRPRKISLPGKGIAAEKEAVALDRNQGVGVANDGHERTQDEPGGVVLGEGVGEMGHALGDGDHGEFGLQDVDAREEGGGAGEDVEIEALGVELEEDAPGGIQWRDRARESRRRGRRARGMVRQPVRRRR
jgi:hypothetical protein